MCGIVGIVDLRQPVQTRVLEAMSATLAHRGPDDTGVFVEGPVGFGHRRLAVLDLTSAGHQPMATADGRRVLNYNGEIYNFRELRARLQARGRRVVSHSDTEVVLQALAEWGTDALDLFNGMFALALWDRDSNKVVLARDRYGMKPLYYTILDGRTLLFASEAKAFLRHPRFHVDLDRPGLYEYLTFQNFFTDRTLLRDVRLLPAGSFATIDLKCAGELEPRITRYWDFSFQEPDDPEDDEAYLEELDRLIRQAVDRQLVSDVPVNCYLSGGMDSGSITALASQQLPNIRTFTIGFDLRSVSGLEIAFDERGFAEHLSYILGTEHYEMVLKAGDLERVMPRLVWQLEEPRVGQSYPNFFAAQLASKFGKVVLSGAGGDEVFGGYPWRYYRAVVNNDFEHYVDKYYQFWQRLMPNSVLQQVAKPMLDDVGNVWTRDTMRDVFVHHAEELDRPEDYINHSLYFEAKTFLHGLLVVEDKLSMAHGLETRMPFLDNDLVDFAQRMPARLKLGNLGKIVRLNENEPGPKTRRYFAKAKDGKLALREVMKRYVPAAFTEREKQGFSAPDASWFRGESMAYVRRRLFNPDATLYEFLDRDAVSTLVHEHLDGTTNRRLLIWSLVYLEDWCRTFLDGFGKDHADG